MVSSIRSVVGVRQILRGCAGNQSRHAGKRIHHVILWGHDAGNTPERSRVAHAHLPVRGTRPAYFLCLANAASSASLMVRRTLTRAQRLSLASTNVQGAISLLVRSTISPTAWL